MPDDIEIRLRTLEDRSVEFKALMSQLVDDIKEIKETLKSAADCRAKIENHGNQLNAMWTKVDGLRIETSARNEQFAILMSQHNECMARHQRETGWITTRLGNMVDKAIPYILIIGAAYLATRWGR